MRKDYDIVGSYDNQRITAITPERTINLFEYIDPNGKRPRVLINTSGLLNTELDLTPNTKGFRGQFVFNDAQFVVIGQRIHRIIDVAGILQQTVVGNLPTEEGYVGIDANTFQIIFVDGVAGFIFDVNANRIFEITDTSFPANPIDVTFLDGFFIVASGGTNNFQLSSLNQGLVWGGSTNDFTASAATDLLTVTGGIANFQTGVPVTVVAGGGLPAPLAPDTTYFVIQSAAFPANTIKLATTYENSIAGTPIDLTTDGTAPNQIVNGGQLQQGAITSHPGNIVACRTLHRRLFLFSEFFTEVHENAGLGTNLPFRRNNSFLIEYGTPAIGSIDVGFDLMYFLSQDRDGLGAVMEVSGVQARPVSNRALDFELSQFAAAGQVEDAIAFLVKENGIIFYRLNFTEANRTFVYDVTQSTQDYLMWHEEQQLNGDRHRAQTHAFFLGRNYVGDFLEPILYTLESDEFTNDGEAIKRERICKPFAPEGYNRVRVDRFQIDMLQGSVLQLTGGEETNYNITTEGGAGGSYDLMTEGGDDLITNQTWGLDIDVQPTVFLSFSKDSGQTFGNIIPVKCGKVGERSFRTVLRKIGTVPRGQAFVPKIQFFNNAPCIILGGSWDFEIMPQ